MTQLNAAARLTATVVTAKSPQMKQIEKQFVDQLKKHGIEAEISFIRDDEIAVEVADKHQFDAAKKILSKVPNLKFNTEDHDPELGFIAWYKF
jgi:preprotein translocase subunit SecD